MTFIGGSKPAFPFHQLKLSYRKHRTFSTFNLQNLWLTKFVSAEISKLSGLLAEEDPKLNPRHIKSQAKVTTFHWDLKTLWRLPSLALLTMPKTVVNVTPRPSIYKSDVDTKTHTWGFKADQRCTITRRITCMTLINYRDLVEMCLHL